MICSAICGTVVKRRHCYSSLVSISKAPIPLPPSCLSLFIPPYPTPSGPTWSQSTIKFTKSWAPLGISVSICIFARCALCIGLCVREGLQARNRSVCSCASVKIWAELSEPSVSKQSTCLLGPRFIDSVTRCVCGAAVRRVVFVFGG